MPHRSNDSVGFIRSTYVCARAKIIFSTFNRASHVKCQAVSKQFTSEILTHNGGEHTRECWLKIEKSLCALAVRGEIRNSLRTRLVVNPEPERVALRTRQSQLATSNSPCLSAVLTRAVHYVT